MRRLLIVSDSPALHSGLARVTGEIASRFHRDGIEVVVAGHAHELAARVPSMQQLPYIVVPNPKGAAPDGLLDKFRPDTVIAIGDWWDFGALGRHRAEHPGDYRLIGYLNIDGEPMAPASAPILDAFDAIATTSEYGARVLGRPGVVPIHHGVDRDVFRPLKKPAQLFDKDLTKTFVVFINAQNTVRKNLSTALAGFAKFASVYGQGDVHCFVNSTMESAIGVNLADVVTELRIPHLVTFNTAIQGQAHPVVGVTDEEIAQMYACSDVLLVTSIAEGFCLPVLEAMATRTVPVATAGFSMLELLADGRGELIRHSATFRGDHGTECPVVSSDAVANMLNVVYEAWKQGRMQTYHRPAMTFALSRPWERTYRLLGDLISRPPRARVADGLSVDPYLRMRAQAFAEAWPDAIAVVCTGGLAEHLDATGVIAAAARHYDRPLVVFANTDPNLYLKVPGVAVASRVKTADHHVVVRSIGDAFPLCLDLRTVSKVWGAPEQTAFFTQHKAHYDGWPQSLGRLGDLGLHVTDVMLKSLGIEPGETIRPIVPERDGGAALPLQYVCVAAGGAAYGHLGRYPDEGWQSIVDVLGGNELAVVQIGDTTDPTIPGTIDHRGETLPRTAAILEHAEMLICTEGPMAHLGAAVDLPSIVLFGPVDPQLYGYGNQIQMAPGMGGDVLCAPCWGHMPWWNAQTCARGVSVCVNYPQPEEVTRVAFQLLKAVKNRLTKELATA